MQITGIFTAGVLLLGCITPFIRHMMYFMRNNPLQSVSQL